VRRPGGEAGWRVALPIAGLPAAALLVAALATGAGARGRFQTDLAALVAMVVAGAFLVRLAWRPLAALALAALLGTVAHLLVGGAPGGAPALALLLLGAGAAPAGLAATGRALGASPQAAGLTATAVLCIALTGVVWADRVGDALPHARRYAFKQAVLDLDAATACAYAAAGFDRLHDPEIYDRVALASSAVRAPGALAPGLAWLAVGLLGGLAGALLGADRRREGPR
jgi:hypothetical protein